LFGLLNMDKPAGISSRDLVNRVQRLTGRVKIGHAGTLDPLARGVLVLCLGPATRLVEYVQRMPKRYRGTFLLGKVSDTEDVDGVVRDVPEAPQPSRQQIEAALPKFVGQIEQLPPAFSALKLQGRRAYDLARSGQPVVLAARPVQIYELHLLGYDYPELSLEIACGSGTYVRSLGRDLAAALGTGAVMAALTRTAIGDFRLEEALDPASLSRETLSRHLLPPVCAVAGLPQVQVTAAQRDRLAQGLPVTDDWNVSDAEIAAIDPAGQLCALLTPGRHHQLRPTRNFPT
jgi:tRNA pseudouridine55 synthase